MLTADQAALGLGLTPARVRQLLAEGRIPGARLERGRWLIPTRFRVVKVRQGRPPNGSK